VGIRCITISYNSSKIKCCGCVEHDGVMMCGFTQVWVRVGVELPMGYPCHALIASESQISRASLSDGHTLLAGTGFGAARGT